MTMFCMAAARLVLGEELQRIRGFDDEANGENAVSYWALCPSE